MGHKMETLTTSTPVLLTKEASEAKLGIVGECDPVTLQVVLLGSDGIVIASDTCATNFNPRSRISTTDAVSKIVTQSRLVHTFAGDECAKQVGAAVAHEVTQSEQVLSAELIEGIANKTLKEWRESSGRDCVDYRKIIWVQAKDARLTIWSAVCDDRAGEFVAKPLQIDYEGKCRAFAGNECNQARYIVEHYYDKYPLRNVSSLKKMAAHLILTGGVFNGGVNGLQMTVGNSNGFEPVSVDEIHRLAELSRLIHNHNDSHFKE